MSKLAKTLRVASLCMLLSGAACGGDDGEGGGGSSIDAATSDAGVDGGKVENPLYLLGANIQTTDESTLYLWTSKQLDGVKLDLKQAREMSGVSDVVPFGGAVYVPNSEKQTITKYTLDGDTLVEGPALSLMGQGLQYVSYVNRSFLNNERAFLVVGSQYKILEWNPTTMTITKTHDISQLKREGWGVEFRGGFMRDDGKYIFYWAYTNNRTDFLNTLTVGVFDTATGQLTFEDDPACPTSAGFGGYFDEQGDLYLIADSFGLFTQFGGFKDPKPACIVRVKKGEAKLDATFKLRPSTAMNGQFPWGFYYVGNGLAFTSGVDPAITSKYNSVFEILFAREHTGWLVDTKNGTARQIANLPKDGVGFESHKVDGRLFVPRTTAAVTIENIMTMESTLFEIKPDATATSILSLPGYINPVARVR